MTNKRPLRVIQFGEGGFLRGFVDWMLQIVNEKTDFDGGVAVVQPIKEGLCDLLPPRIAFTLIFAEDVREWT
jgi:tagaturonate reductase